MLGFITSDCCCSFGKSKFIHFKILICLQKCQFFEIVGICNRIFVERSLLLTFSPSNIVVFSIKDRVFSGI